MAEGSSENTSGNSSVNPSRPASVSGAIRQGHRPAHRVKFSMNVGPNLENNESQKRLSLPEIRIPEPEDIANHSLQPTPTKPDHDWVERKTSAALLAHSKASRLAHKMSSSVPASPRRTSLEDHRRTLSPPAPYLSPPQKPLSDQTMGLDDIPLETLDKAKSRRVFDLSDESTDEDDSASESQPKQPLQRQPDTGGAQHDEARRLVRTFTRGMAGYEPSSQRVNINSGTQTPAIDRRPHDYEYVPQPSEYKPSVLSTLLASKLAPYQHATTDPRRTQDDYFSNKTPPRHSALLSGTQSPYYDTQGSSGRSSGRNTPKRPKWYKQDSYQSTGSMAQLLSSTSTAMAAAVPAATNATRPPLSRSASTGLINTAVSLIKNPVSHVRNGSRADQHAHAHAVEVATQSVADILARRKYLIKLCRALMITGAPTHRLEEYMTMSARKLLVLASFQYLPNCMIISFDDPDTHTTEVHLVKESTAIDLGKFKDVQEVYKDVIHEKYSIDEAMTDINAILTKPKKFNTAILIVMYGFAAISVGPFAFGAQPMDFFPAFGLGCLLGWLQLVWAARSTQFSHIFEVFATVVTSFLARGLGSIVTNDGTPVFCFSALAQSSIALILPGWIILAASLELQSRNLIAGSIRMVYAIIYTLFLGFGILIGVTIMGLIYPGATDAITCTVPEYWDASKGTQWKLIYTKFIWVPCFTICLAMINQAKWKQMPAMLVISFAGYQVNYWSSQRFGQNLQVANALGALAIGTLANMYSRFLHGVAAAAMLPAIFVQVPSGLAASGSLVAGLTSANQITQNATGISIINNGTQGFYDAQNVTTSTTVYGGTIFNVGYGMVQVAIGISVGLALSALVVYPFGKKRSGLFSF